MSARMESERSLGQLFSDLTQETKHLVQQEVQLAKTELTQKAAVVGKNVAFLAIGGFILYAGLLVILAALVMLLGNAIGAIGAAFLVGAIVIGVGIALVIKGKNALTGENLAPRETKAQLKETAQWAREQAR